MTGSIESRLFRRKRWDRESMEQYGFVRTGDALFYAADFMDGDFRAELTVRNDGTIHASVIDTMNDEEYTRLRSDSFNGAYVNTVRSAYEELLSDIAEKCCSDVAFASDQSNRIAQQIYERYNVSPDFPWDTDSIGEYGVFRHQDTGKWFGLIMNIRKGQLDTSEDQTHADVVNLKKNMDDAVRTDAMKGVFPAYHMNHRLWISVLLDDTLDDSDVMKLVDDSFRLTSGGKGRISEELIRQVLEIADNVPAGKVMTYGQIAKAAGVPKNARLVGKIMSMADRYGDHPCHRVVNHAGRTVPGWAEQRAMLEAEGVTFTAGGCVDMKKHNVNGTD